MTIFVTETFSQDLGVNAIAASFSSDGEHIVLLLEDGTLELSSTPQEALDVAKRGPALPRCTVEDIHMSSLAHTTVALVSNGADNTSVEIHDVLLKRN